MNDNEQLMDQSQLAEDVAKKIRYEFKDKFLVKPLDPVMVKKEFTKLPENKQAVTDENNIEAVDIIVWRSGGQFSKPEWFDLLKVTVLVRAYDLVAIERCGD